MSMDFIKILGDVISEQVNFGAGQAGVNAGQQAASGGSSQVPSHSWVSGDKMKYPLETLKKCNHYGQIRDIGTPDERTHNACDVSVNVGTGILAPYDGKVIWFSNSDCGDGIDLTGEVDGKTLYSRFCHLRDRNKMVPSNSEVTKGQPIGTSGGAKREYGSGNSGGPHLHWSFKVDGVSTNPYTYN